MQGANSVEGYGPVMPDCFSASGKEGSRVDFQECLSTKIEKVILQHEFDKLL